MVRAEKIINKIVKDGKQQVKEVLLAAQQENEASLKLAKIEANEYIKSVVSETQKQCEENLKIAKQNQNAEENRAILLAKNEVLDKIFQQVLFSLQNLEYKEYLKFVNDLLINYAENKDVVVLSKDKKLKSKDVLALDVMKQKSLTISKEEGDFFGGFVLINNVCDKDFSFETIVCETRELILSRVAKDIF